ncbi:hypothetical protein [Gordonia paraffinivorans]|uniref:hypothetical protein n=1 Tax=Gordonia paraffinivorans TaxID=175628 RepID=UPI001B355088|nr:hypothetical protein [Gordonia paraffinivorans]
MRLPSVCSRALGVLASVSAVAVLVGGCGADETPSAGSSATTTTPASRPVDPEACAQTPPQGSVDRSGQNLKFSTGSIRIAISQAPPPPGSPPGATTSATPKATESGAPGPDAEPESRCYEFERWGPQQPDVPPDSLLFVFKGAGTDGAQIEFVISELTGGIVPPAGGGPRPTAGPLLRPINAQIGVSVDGVYHHSPACQLALTAMSGKLAAGSFTCPAATRVDANPFAPDDDVPFDADESSAAPQPDPGATADTVLLGGWFELRP